MEPPVLDPIGKNQSKPALDPDQRPAHTEEGALYLERVLGTSTNADATAALAPTVPAPVPGKRLTKVQRARMRLTQQILAGLAAGESVIDLADRLGVATSTVTGHVARHRREVEAAEIDARLDEIAVPLATDNLIHGLIAGDKDYTLETLKGRGKFRRHTEDTGAGKTELPVLRIAIDVGPGAGSASGVRPDALPAPSANQMIAGGRIVGVMRLPKSALPDIEVPKREEAEDAVQIAGTPRTTP